MRHQLSDTEYLPLWPLIIVLEDCFVPYLAENVITACAELDSQTITTSWDLIAMNAREEMKVN